MLLVTSCLTLHSQGLKSWCVAPIRWSGPFLVTSKNHCLENGILSFQSTVWVPEISEIVGISCSLSPRGSDPMAGGCLQVNGINWATCSLSCFFGLLFPRFSWSQGCSLLALSKQAELDKNTSSCSQRFWLCFLGGGGESGSSVRDLSVFFTNKSNNVHL